MLLGGKEGGRDEGGGREVVPLRCSGTVDGKKLEDKRQKQHTACVSLMMLLILRVVLKLCLCLALLSWKSTEMLSARASLCG